jgi:GGDEF domain-containing protein
MEDEIDNYRYERTDTALDSVGSEPEMLARFKALQANDSVFQVVYFRVASIPEINEKYGRGIGNMMLSEYVNFFKQTFVVDNYIYRTSGLEFVAFITNYNKMEMLKSQLRNDEQILHASANLAGEKINTEIYMGISYSNDTPNPNDALSNAKNSLKIAANDNYSSSYAYFKDIR